MAVDEAWARWASHRMRASLRKPLRGARGEARLSVECSWCSRIAGWRRSLLSSLRASGGGRPTAPKVITLPRDTVVLAVVRRPAPERAVLPVEEDRIDGTGRAVIEVQPVTHRAQLVT